MQCPSRIGLGTGERGEDPDRRKGDDESGAAVGDERQGQAGDRHETQHTADVDRRLPDEPERDRGGHQPPERVRDPACDAQAGEGQHGEEGDHHDAAGEGQQPRQRCGAGREPRHAGAPAARGARPVPGSRPAFA